MMQHIREQLKLEEGREMGREEGREEGRKEGRKEGHEEGRKKGREEGREVGRNLEKVMLIKKKIQKSKSVEVIADELECEVEGIRELYEGIQHCGTDCEVEEVMEYLNAKNKRIRENH